MAVRSMQIPGEALNSHALANRFRALPLLLYSLLCRCYAVHLLAKPLLRHALPCPALALPRLPCRCDASPSWAIPWPRCVLPFLALPLRRDPFHAGQFPCDAVHRISVPSRIIASQRYAFAVRCPAVHAVPLPSKSILSIVSNEVSSRTLS